MTLDLNLEAKLERATRISGLKRSALEFLIIEMDENGERHHSAFSLAVALHEHRTGKNADNIPAATVCEAFVKLAKQRYGMLAKSVLASFGVKSTRDIGLAVYSLIATEFLRASSSDSIQDFDDVFDWDETLDYTEELKSVEI